MNYFDVIKQTTSSILYILDMNSTKTIEMNPSSSGDQYEDVYIRLREVVHNGLSCVAIISLRERELVALL